MLFLFGTRSSKLGEYPLAGVRCINCGTPGSVTVVVFSRYFHLFWLPLFPVGKRAVSVCTHCQQALEQKQWPPAYQGPGQQAAQQARVPLTHFLGLLLVGALVVVGVVIELLGGKHSAVPAAASEPALVEPQPSDIYAAAAPTGHGYNLLRVVRASTDSVVLQPSTYQPRSLEALRQHPDSARLGCTGSPLALTRANFTLMQRANQAALVRP